MVETVQKFIEIGKATSVLVGLDIEICSNACIENFIISKFDLLASRTRHTYRTYEKKRMSFHL